MAELLNLTVPEFASAGTSNYGVKRLVLSINPPAVDVFLEGGGYEKRIMITGAEATTLLITLNTANFSTTSLMKRILLYLVSSGRLGGTVTG